MKQILLLHVPLCMCVCMCIIFSIFTKRFLLSISIYQYSPYFLRKESFTRSRICWLSRMAGHHPLLPDSPNILSNLLVLPNILPWLSFDMGVRDLDSDSNDNASRGLLTEPSPPDWAISLSLSVTPMYYLYIKGTSRLILFLLYVFYYGASMPTEVCWCRTQWCLHYFPDFFILRFDGQY